MIPLNHFFLTYIGNGACISSGTSVTSPTAFKYQAAVYCPTIMCSGAIVSSRNVLTTASCINNLSPEDVQVYVGSVSYYSGGYIFNVENIEKHPSFSPSSFNNNIAILTVATPFDFSIGTVQPIPLAITSPPFNSFVITTAYGAVDPSYTLPDVLQKASLQVYPLAICQMYKNNRITLSMFCAGDPKGNRDLCPGDQGITNRNTKILM